MNKINYFLITILLFSLPLVAMKRAYSSKGKEGEGRRTERIYKSVTIKTIDKENITFPVVTTEFGFGKWLKEFPGKGEIKLPYSQYAIEKLQQFEEALLQNRSLTGRALFNAIEQQAEIMNDLAYHDWQELKNIADFLNFHEFTAHLEHVVLIANNGTRFAIPGNSIKYSETISSLLSTLISQEEQTGKIPFSNINAQDLAIVADVLEKLGDVNLSGKELLDSLKKKVSKLTTLPNDRLLSLLSVANFLDFPVLLQLIAQQVACNIKNNHLNLEEIKNTFETVPPILAEVGRQYYLLFGDRYLEMDVNYGFSVKELYEYGKGKEIHNNELNLANMRINSLEGFDEQTIPGFKNLTDLNLSYNQLTNLPQGIFNNCTALTNLHLSNNELTSVPKGIFANLTSLTSVGLGLNELINLPDGIFTNCTALESLFLSNNQLTSLPEKIFENTSLELLDLTNNKLNDEERQKIKQACTCRLIYF